MEESGAKLTVITNSLQPNRANVNSKIQQCILRILLDLQINARISVHRIKTDDEELSLIIDKPGCPLILESQTGMPPHSGITNRDAPSFWNHKPGCPLILESQTGMPPHSGITNRDAPSFWNHKPGCPLILKSQTGMPPHSGITNQNSLKMQIIFLNIR